MTNRTFDEIKSSLVIYGFGNPGDASYNEILQALEFSYNAPAAPGVTG